MSEVSAPGTGDGAKKTNIQSQLTDWNIAIEDLLEANQAEMAAALATVILRKLPRHLPTYQRLLRATWLLKRWDEGRRLGAQAASGRPQQPAGVARRGACSRAAWRASARPRHLAARLRGRSL
ncbi:MAG: hypothetical protein HC802_05115 [Caldilineaceae bacterium]|nr:hypothetical protein [Caldilineaceae bacterium]